MPHVVVTGKVSPEDAAGILGPDTEKEGDLILRTTAAYVATDGSNALVEGVVVAGGKPQPLLALVGRREDGVVLRLSPFMESVDRTEPVFRWVAWLGRRVQESAEGLGYGPTNLDRYLGRGR